jgi:hypothetical protein
MQRVQPHHGGVQSRQPQLVDVAQGDTEARHVQRRHEVSHVHSHGVEAEVYLYKLEFVRIILNRFCTVQDQGLKPGAFKLLVCVNCIQLVQVPPRALSQMRAALAAT